MMRRLFIAVFFSFLAVRCAEIKSFPSVSFQNQTICSYSPTKYSQSIFAYLNSLPAPFIIEEKTLETERYQSFFLSMPSTGINGQRKNLATARYFKNKFPGQKKLIIILPIYGSSTYPPSVMALRFTEWNRSNDTNALVVFGKNDFYDLDALANADTEKIFLKAIEDSAERIKNSIIDIRRFIDWATAQPEINQKRIGIIGFSIGASTASIVTGIDSRITSSAFLMGGVNLDEIFAFSKADFLIKVQEKIIKKLGWTRKILSKKIKSSLEPVNPKYFTACALPNTRQVIIVEAVRDQYIPKSARDDLWIAWQKPKRIFVYTSHKMAFLGMTIFNFNRLDHQIFEFFEKNL